MIVPQMTTSVKVDVWKKQVVCRIWFWRSRVPTSDARNATIASDDTRRISNPPKCTGRLACSHINRREKEMLKFYIIHHTALDQIWSRFHEHSMATHVAYAGALVR